MPTDTLTRLDPARADDPRFDARGPAADRVLERSTSPRHLEHRVAPRSTSPRHLVRGDRSPRGRGSLAGVRPEGETRGRRGLAGLALAGAVAAVVAAVVVTADEDALRPAEAFAAAVERTASFESGRAQIHTVVLTPSGSKELDAIHEVRFAPGASETTQRAAPGTAMAGASSDGVTLRLVDGRAWIRTPGGAWETLSDARRDALADEARAIAGDRSLAALVRSAHGVTQDGDTFRATVDGAAIRALENPPFGLAEMRDLDRVAITMTLAPDETIAELVVAYGDVTRTITYEDLGVPQDIPAP